MTTKYSYSYEELFEEIPGDEEHITFIIPAEILEEIPANSSFKVKVEEGNIIIQIT